MSAFNSLLAKCRIIPQSAPQADGCLEAGWSLNEWPTNPTCAAELHQAAKKYYFAYQCVDLTAYFQMDDDSDLRREILHIEARLEELTDVVERCRKIILISKAAVAAGGILILAMVIGAVGFDSTAMIGAVAAVIGGTVVFGSNTSTLKQITAEMKAAEAHRSELISRLHLRVAGDGEVES